MSERRFHSGKIDETNREKACDENQRLFLSEKAGKSMNENRTEKRLTDTLERCVTPYHTVSEGIRQLKEAGFTELKPEKEWGLNQGGAYFVSPYPSMLIAFRLGKEFGYNENLRIAMAHTDHPGFHLKPKAEMVQGEYLKCNVEIYGGAILYSWLDRPLSAAGRVAVRSRDIFAPQMQYVDFKRPLFTIPSLAIHMNREVNKGVEFNRQNELLPLAGMISGQIEENGFIKNMLAKELNVKPEDILDFDLGIYNCEKPEYIGMKDEFISSPRLDNITSVQACLTGIIEGSRKNGINAIVLFDNEEVGSGTKQGAKSLIFPNILEKIFLSMNRSRIKFINSVTRSIMLSLDVAHGLHPNYVSKSDPTNQVYLNRGVVIKTAGTQSYATDTEAIGIFMQICEKERISFQKAANRSDVPSGSTLGSLASSVLPVKTVDIGIPVLAMHSARELMGREDQNSLEKAVTAFFTIS